MQTAHIIIQQSVYVCRDGCQSGLVSPWISHWRILIMLWMFVQLYEDNKVSCFRLASLANQPTTVGKQRAPEYWHVMRTFKTVGKGGWSETMTQKTSLDSTYIGLNYYLRQEVPYEKKIATASSADWKGQGILHQVSFCFFQYFFKGTSYKDAQIEQCKGNTS